MDKIKITNHQLFAFVANCSCGTSVIIVSSSLAGIAKQDAWISSIITPILGLFFIWMYSYLSILYPDKSYVNIICSVFGKYLGTIISVGFISICLLDVPQLTWYVGNFVRTQFFPKTPTYVVNGLLIIALVIALLYGIESIMRFSEISVYIVSFILILVFIIVSPNAEIHNIMPVLENGITPVLKGSFVLSSYTTWPLIILNMIYPTHVNDIKNARKYIFGGYLWGSFIIFLCTISTILILGSTIAAKSQFPTYLVTAEVNIESILARIESAIAIIWFITIFSKLLLYFYGGVIGLSELLKLKNHKIIVIPLGFIALIYSDIVYPNITYEAEWDTITWIPFISTFAVILPIVILIISKIKIWIKQTY